MTNDYLFDYEMTNKLLLGLCFGYLIAGLVFAKMCELLLTRRRHIDFLQEALATAAKEIEVKKALLKGADKEMLRLHKKNERCKSLLSCVTSHKAVSGMQRKIDRQAKTISHLCDRVNVLKSIIDDYEKRYPKS